MIDIKRGINAGEFVLHYQPIVELSSMAIAGYEALMRWGHKHTKLTLEITERVAIDMCDQHHFEALKTISKMDWVMLALDDFGLASIVQMLQVLEVFDDPQKLKVKLDMYFMQNLNKPRMRQTIKIIVQTIHEYGIKIVCEGVETDEQLEFLQAIACDFAQGFHPKLGKPMAIS